jgi:stearoyl-CoA desaturase (delta-9 desaturase)
MKQPGKVNIVALVTIFGPPAVVAFVVPLLWGRAVTSLDLLLLGFFYCVTVLGLTVGFHRLFCHRSFEGAPWLRMALGILGCMAAQGPLQFWVATHRKHHITSDTDDDSHSPHAFGEGLGATLRGWWHAHLGWMLRAIPTDLMKNLRDLRRDTIVLRCDRYYGVWVALGLLLPGLIGAAVGADMASFLRGMLWGGLIRIFLVHHVTWSINSVCHMVGRAPFATGDHSRNNFVCALLSFGEGWHNNHHAVPYSARHGFSARQPDVAWWFIRACERLGLVWNIRLPAPELLQRKNQTNTKTQ